MAQIDPAAADVVDTDSLPRLLAQSLGVSPHGIRSAKHVAAIREQRQRAMQEQAEAENLGMRAKAAQSIAQARHSSEGGRPRGS